jgi:hypothetical protein
MYMQLDDDADDARDEAAKKHDGKESNDGDKCVDYEGCILEHAVGAPEDGGGCAAELRGGEGGGGGWEGGGGMQTLAPC